SAARNQQCGHLRLVHADTDTVTGDARLRHFEQSAADLVMVADAHLLVGPAFDREVLAKLPIDEVVSTELVLPIAIGVDLIDEDGPVFAAMPNQVPLPIPVDIEPPHHPPALNRCLPDSGVDSLSCPCDVAWQADIDRKQTCQHFLLQRLTAHSG